MSFIGNCVAPVFLAFALTACGTPEPAALDPDCPARPHGFPAELERFRPKVEATALAYARIEARIEATQSRDSKFLGVPYWPKDRPFPTDVEGNALELLAQINFAEVPPLEDYPSNGLLQFFIAPYLSDKHVWGMETHDGSPFDQAAYFARLQQQDFFRVVYHPSPTLADEFLIDEAPTRSRGLMPIDDEARLSFAREVGYVLPSDYRFQSSLGIDLYTLYDQLGAASCTVMEAYTDYAGGIPLAKVGGYASPVQDDPRKARPDEDWLVLLEIQSGRLGDSSEVTWGDLGMAMFLIRRSDLRQRDFSRVAYYWDNH